LLIAADEDRRKQEEFEWRIRGIIIGVSVVIALIVGYFLYRCYKKRKQKKETAKNQGLQLVRAGY
jgi:uncharacterized protein YpmB